jgi:hypothetical protein
MAVKQVFNTSAELDYPTVLPTLDLDFANSKTLDPRITFTRASGGSYVGADGLIKYAGVNEARFDHDPETGESLGLLIEEARTNLLTRSEEFDDASWSLTNSSILKADIISPDGSKNAYILKEDTSNGEHAIRRASQFFSSGVSYTASFFVKKYNDSIRKIEIRASNLFWGGARVVFNPTNGEIEIIGSPGVVKIDKLNNGWYRVCITTTTTTGGSTVTFGLGIYPDNDRVYTGDGTSGVYIWGAQLEEGASPTSYIPTQASTRTRASDVATIQGKNFSDWFNPDAGTLYTALRINAALANMGALKIRQTGLDARQGIGFKVDNRSNQNFLSFITSTRKEILRQADITPGNLVVSFGNVEMAGAYDKKNTLLLASFLGNPTLTNVGVFLLDNPDLFEIGASTLFAEIGRAHV